MPYRHFNGGWVELICGSMFSGKTEEMIRRIRRAQIAKQTVQVFKPKLDDRYHDAHVASHNGMQMEAQAIDSAPEILDLLEDNVSVVAIDEVQFFDWAVADVAETLADRGVRVIMAGLDTDFRGEPFGPMPLLMAQAEIIDKLTAICVKCTAPASRTQRLIDGEPAYYEDPVIMVGAKEMYEARCRHCHEVPRRSEEKEPVEV